MPSITAPQVLSLLVRNSPISKGMKGSEERDMLFARLFGLTVVVQSSALFSAESSISDFDTVLDRLAELGKAKGWLRESAWWGILQAVEMLFASQAAWKEEAVEGLVRRIKEEKNWNQEKIALVLLLERERPVCRLSVSRVAVLTS
jgi:DNA polymerase phi